MSDAHHPSIAVVMPVYNRSQTLRRSLASLEAQDYPPGSLTVIVADDGSEEDIETVVGEWKPPCDKLYVRQEHRGFGAARARNLGASATDADLIVFLDSDALVWPDFVSRHAAIHEANRDAVAIGGRVHLPRGEVNIDNLALGVADLEPAGNDSEDFRATLARRTSGYQATDEGYRAFVSSNVSLPRELFEEVGGFDERFRWWGSEDTELGWRLWQAGALFIDAADNVIFHQLDEDTAGGAGGRQRARELNRGLLSSLVPQRFYRKGLPDPLPEVPKISLIAHDLPQGAPEEVWKALRSQTLPDFEVVYVADGGEHDPFAGACEGDPRCRFIGDPGTAVRASRGEYVLFVNGHAALSPSLLQNVRKRLDQRPAASALTIGIEVPGEGLFGTVEDVSRIDEAWATDLPTALAVRRRALIRALREGAPLPQAISALAAKNSLHTRLSLIALPGSVRTERPEGFSHGKSTAKQLWEEAQQGPAGAFRSGLRAMKSLVRPQPATESPPFAREPGSVPLIRYVGWVGKDNLGDEAMLQATSALIGWGRVEARGEARDLLILGGGTLINRNQYLRWLVERDSPRIERAVLGTGVADPEYWGLTEDTDEWVRWLGTCAYVGVRGPRSAEIIAKWGHKGEIETCGDPALALKPPDTDPTLGRVLIAPAATGGELWGKSDSDVYAAIAGAAERWIDEGREVVLMSSHPADDRPIIEIRERLGGRPTAYVPGYIDIAESLSEIARAELIVGERLHACVLAAAAGRPFIGIEYRPKVRDFARSVEMEDRILRTDQLEVERLLELAATSAPVEAMNTAVATYRSRLEAASNAIHDALGS